MPLSEQEEQRRRGRAADRSRRIKRYVGFPIDGTAVPHTERLAEATLAAWIRQCKCAGLFNEGRLLFERGLNLDGLSEEAQAEVEEDHRSACGYWRGVRRISLNTAW